MPNPYPDHLRRQFARWVASGGTVPSWCLESGVPLPTAYRWHRADWFKRRVRAYRRHLVDRAIGKMVPSFSAAVAPIDGLLEQGETDDVTLAAACTLIDNMLDVGRRADKAEARRLISPRPER